MLTVTLKTPITLPNNEVLTEVSLRKANAGNLATARAAIVRDTRFGREMVDDNLTLAMFMLPRMVVSSNVVKLPDNWVFQTDEDDLSQLADAYAALRSGFDSVEAYRADVQAKRQQAQSDDPAVAQDAAFREQLPAGQTQAD